MYCFVCIAAEKVMYVLVDKDRKIIFFCYIKTEKLIYYSKKADKLMYCWIKAEKLMYCWIKAQKLMYCWIKAQKLTYCWIKAEKLMRSCWIKTVT